MSDHSPEPWKIGLSGGIVDFYDCMVAGWRGHEADDCYGMAEADIRRIVACVNFCREFPTEFLEKHQMHFARKDEPRAHIPVQLVAIKEAVQVVERLEIE